jgi:hypothetical protein
MQSQGSQDEITGCRKASFVRVVSRMGALFFISPAFVFYFFQVGGIA